MRIKRSNDFNFAGITPIRPIRKIGHLHRIHLKNLRKRGLRLYGNTRLSTSKRTETSGSGKIQSHQLRLIHELALDFSSHKAKLKKFLILTLSLPLGLGALSATFLEIMRNPAKNDHIFHGWGLFFLTVSVFTPLLVNGISLLKEWFKGIHGLENRKNLPDYLFEGKSRDPLSKIPQEQHKKILDWLNEASRFSEIFERTALWNRFFDDIHLANGPVSEPSYHDYETEKRPTENGVLIRLFRDLYFLDRQEYQKIKEKVRYIYLRRKQLMADFTSVANAIFFSSNWIHVVEQMDSSLERMTAMMEKLTEPEKASIGGVGRLKESVDHQIRHFIENDHKSWLYLLFLDGKESIFHWPLIYQIPDHPQGEKILTLLRKISELNSRFFSLFSSRSEKHSVRRPIGERKVTVRAPYNNPLGHRTIQRSVMQYRRETQFRRIFLLEEAIGLNGDQKDKEDADLVVKFFRDKNFSAKLKSALAAEEPIEELMDFHTALTGLEPIVKRLKKKFQGKFKISSHR